MYHLLYESVKSVYRVFNSGGRIISLDNFDSSSAREPILTSPRSLEACRRQGIDPPELIMKNIEQIKELYRDRKFDREGFEMMARSYEDRRREKVKILLDERQQIIQEEKNGLITFSATTGQPTRSLAATKGNASSGLVERERALLSKLSEKREKEIEQILEYEKKLEEKRNKQEMKKQKQLDKEKAQREEAERKHAEEEKKKEIMEINRKKKADEKERERLEAERLKDQKEHQREQRKQEDMQERLRQLKKKEEEKERYYAKLELKREEDAKAKQIEFEKKENEKKVKEERRDQFWEDQRTQKQQKAEEQRLHQLEGLERARNEREEKMKAKNDKIEGRIKKNEELMKMYEENRERRKQELKEMAAKHIEEIHMKQDKNKLELQKRIAKFMGKMERAEHHLKELEDQALIDKQKKLQEIQKKQQDIDNVLKKNADDTKIKIQGFIDKLSQIDRMVEEVQHSTHNELQHKHNVDMVKRIEREENVKRISKMRSYQRKRFMDKILDGDARAQDIRDERNKLMEQRQTMRAEIEASKKEMIEKFKATQQQKLEMAQVAEENMKLGGTFPANKSTKDFRIRKESRNKSPKSFAHTDKGGLLGGGSLIATPKKGEVNLINKDKEPPATKPVEKKPIDPSKMTASEKEARKEIENLKLKQNSELLLILQDEQKAEAERQEKLMRIGDLNERRKAEKALEPDREKARIRIEKIRERHNDEKKQIAKRNNLKGFEI